VRDTAALDAVANERLDEQSRQHRHGRDDQRQREGGDDARPIGLGDIQQAPEDLALLQALRADAFGVGGDEHAALGAVFLLIGFALDGFQPVRRRLGAVFARQAALDLALQAQDAAAVAAGIANF